MQDLCVCLGFDNTLCLSTRALIKKGTDKNKVNGSYKSIGKRMELEPVETL